MQYRQQQLFQDDTPPVDRQKPVNVSSIPQRSPFRYPGGKTWFVPVLRDWLSNRYIKPTLLVEPFAGGGIISLTSVFENLVPSVVMVEIDADVAAVWQSIMDGHAQWLGEKIQKFELSNESVVAELSRAPADTRERAFQTILKNRTYHGGILAEGSGLLKFGENGKGIHSRWYPRTLARRFNDISSIAGRLEFRQMDGLDVIEEFSNDPKVVFFIDPPYTAGGKRAGKRLYRHFSLDHELLFSHCRSIKGDFLMTYDDAEEVKVMARRHGFDMRLIPMNNTHHARMEELVIGKDLSWMDHYPAVHEPRCPPQRVD